MRNVCLESLGTEPRGGEATRIPFRFYLEMSLSSKVAKHTFNTEHPGQQDSPETADSLTGKQMFLAVT